MITIKLVLIGDCLFPETPLPTEGVVLTVYGAESVTVYMEGDELPTLGD